MDCPRCKLALREAEYEGVPVDLCDNCWGIWLDQGELRGILETQEMRFSDAERRQITKVRGESSGEPATTEPTPCPRCGRAMDVIHSDLAIQLVIDRCPDHGVWLDTGEAKAIQVAAEESAEMHRLLLRKLGVGQE